MVSIYHIPTWTLWARVQGAGFVLRLFRIVGFSDYAGWGLGLLLLGRGSPASPQTVRTLKDPKDEYVSNKDNWRYYMAYRGYKYHTP